MTTQFLRFYVSNLKVLSSEMNRNQQLLQLLNDNIKRLTLEAEQRLKQFFADMMKSKRLYEDPVEQNTQIKIIYLLLKQIQKSDAEKRSLTRKACDILDKYLASLYDEVKSATTLNVQDRHGGELLQMLSSIQLQTDQPLQGNAVIIDLIKKMENGRAQNSNESNVLVLDDVNRNIEVIGSVQNFKSLAVTNNISDLIYRLDNQQVFTDKIMDICMDMKIR